MFSIISCIIVVAEDKDTSSPPTHTTQDVCNMSRRYLKLKTKQSGGSPAFLLKLCSSPSVHFTILCLNAFTKLCFRDLSTLPLPSKGLNSMGSLCPDYLDCKWYQHLTEQSFQAVVFHLNLHGKGRVSIFTMVVMGDLVEVGGKVRGVGQSGGKKHALHLRKNVFDISHN